MSTPDIYGYAIFCDDIREELGGKISLMGVYNGSLQVASDAPVSLPKLGIALTLIFSGPQKFEEVAFYVQQEAEGQVIDLFRATPDLPPLPDVAPGRIGKLGMNIQLAPFSIQGNCVLKARASVNGQEVKLGTIQVLLMPAAVEGETDRTVGEQ